MPNGWRGVDFISFYFLLGDSHQVCYVSSCDRGRSDRPRGRFSGSRLGALMKRRGRSKCCVYMLRSFPISPFSCYVSAQTFVAAMGWWDFNFLHVLQKHPSTTSCKPDHARIFSLSGTFGGAHCLAHYTSVPAARCWFGPCGVAMLKQTVKTAAPSSSHLPWPWHFTACLGSGTFAV